jgi:hypothetical protein
VGFAICYMPFANLPIIGGFMGEKIIVTVAVTGSRPKKEMNPAVPYSPKDRRGGCGMP